MSETEQSIALESLLQSLNENGSVLQANEDGSVLATTPEGEAVIVYYMEEPAPEDGVVLLNGEEIHQPRSQVVCRDEGLEEEDHVTQIVLTGEDGVEQTVHLQTNTIQLDPNSYQLDQNIIVENDIQLNQDPLRLDQNESEMNADGNTEVEKSRNPLQKFINEGSLDQLSEIVIYRERTPTPVDDGGGFVIQPPPPPRTNPSRRKHHECELCQRVFPHVRALREHKRTPGPCKRMWLGGQKPLVCDVCGKSYSRALRYKAHLATHLQPEQGKIQCTECEKTFRIKWEMIQHRLKRHGLGAEEFSGLADRKCNKCGRQFKFRKSFLKHQSNGCSKVSIQIYECNTCGKRYMSDTYLQKHLEKCKSEDSVRETKTDSVPIVCSECDSVFEIVEALARHMEEVHGMEDGEGEEEGGDVTIPEENLNKLRTDEDIVKMVYACPRELASRSYVEHSRTACQPAGAEPGAPNRCPHCDRIFSSRQYLDVHIRSHTGEKPFKCEDCEEAFATRGSYQNHRVRVHRTETPYRCPDCDKYFITKDDLKVHCLVHTGERPHQCQYCESRCKTTSHLAKHMRVHTGERPYPCSYCPKRFMSIGSRNQHLRAHTKEKPYPCDMCVKTFVTSSLRLAHRRSHTGEMRYICDVCNSAYIYRYQLKNHEEAHEKGQIEPGRTFCSVCNQWFGSDTFQEHFKSSHSVKHWYVCRGCSRKFVLEKNCLSHEKSHADIVGTGVEPAVGTGVEPAMGTGVEPAMGTGVGEPAVRLDIAEPELEPECSKCGVQFFNRETLGEHELGCTGPAQLVRNRESTKQKQYENPDYVLIDDDEQEQAIRKIRQAIAANDVSAPSLNGLTCPKCRYKFKFYDAFCIHMEANCCRPHTKSGRILCQRCRKTFKHFKGFYAHRDEGNCSEEGDGRVGGNADRGGTTAENPCASEGIRLSDMSCTGCERKFTGTACYVRHLKEGHNCDESCSVEVATTFNDESEETEPVVEPCEEKSARQKRTVLRAGVGKAFFRRWQNLRCPGCEQLFHTAAGLSKHHESKPECRPANSLDDEYHPCGGCAKVFEVKSHLNQHFKEHSFTKHPGFKCDVCDRGLEKRASDIPHSLVEHGRMPFRCRICSKTAPSLKTLEKHVKERHLTSVPETKSTKSSTSKRGTRFQCGQCGETFLSAGVLLLHNQKHVEDAKPSKRVKLACKYCGLKCNSQQRLDIHSNACRMRDLPGETVFCPECVTEFRSKPFCDQHVQSCHAPPETRVENASSCPVCGATFENEALFRMHARFHGAVTASDVDELLNPPGPRPEDASTTKDDDDNESEEPASVIESETANIAVVPESGPRLEYRCLECGTGFQRRSSIAAHVRRAHTGRVNLIEEIRYHQCEVCAARLDSHESLVRHYGDLHSNDSRTTENMISTGVETEENVQFECSKCSILFSDTESFLTHMNEHEESPAKRTRRQSSAEKGVKHTWYSCSSCEEMFESEQALLRHEFYSHTHTCGQCTETFPTEAVLEGHVCDSSIVSNDCEPDGGNSCSLPTSSNTTSTGTEKRVRKRKVYQDFEMEGSGTPAAKLKKSQVGPASVEVIGSETAGEGMNSREPPGGQVQHVVVYSVSELQHNSGPAVRKRTRQESRDQSRIKRK